ncbi:MAG: metal ABC transporter permease [Caldisericum sp.]
MFQLTSIRFVRKEGRASFTKTMNPIIIRSLIAGVLTSFLCALIGVFVVLRKMSFFAHAVSHASLAGVALAYLTNTNPFVGAIGVGLLTGVGVSYFVEKSQLFSDTIIGILLPFSMSIGLILVSFVKGYKPDLMSYLFGDILSTSKFDIYLIIAISIPVIIITAILMKRFILISVDIDLAKIRGYNVILIDYIFMAILSLIVLISTKIVGIILVSALVVIPPATALNISRNMRETFIYSVIFGIAGSILGIGASYILNLPTGPAIIFVISVIFLLSLLFKKS